MPSLSSQKSAIGPIVAVGVAVAVAAGTLLYLKNSTKTNKGDKGLSSTSDANSSTPSAPKTDAATVSSAAAPTPTTQQLNDVAQAINMGNAMKLKGNALLAAGKIEEAMACYQDTLDFLSYIPNLSNEVKRTQQVVAANLLHCLVKKNLFPEGQMLATDLLEDDVMNSAGGNSNNSEATTSAGLAGGMPDDLKAKIIYRRAMCSIGMGLIEGAIADLEAADVLSKGSNADVKKELAKLKGQL